MRRKEILWEIYALIMVIASLSGLTIGIYAFRVYQVVERLDYAESIVIEARIHEAGGWFPSTIVVEVGKPIRLMIYSVDMVHSLVIPELGVDSGSLIPGEWRTIDLLISKAGFYEFHCGILCSPMHGFMEGVIIVVEGDVRGFEPSV